MDEQKKINPRELVLSIVTIGVTMFLGVALMFYFFSGSIGTGLAYGLFSGCSCSGLWAAFLLFLLILRKLTS